jgi:hypothetical protein
MKSERKFGRNPLPKWAIVACIVPSSIVMFGILFALLVWVVEEIVPVIIGMTKFSAGPLLAGFLGIAITFYLTRLFYEWLQDYPPLLAYTFLVVGTLIIIVLVLMSLSDIRSSFGPAPEEAGSPPGAERPAPEAAPIA